MLSFIDDFKPAQMTTPILAGLGAPADLEQSLGTFTSRAGGLVVLISDLLSPSWEKRWRGWPADLAIWLCCTRCRRRSCGRHSAVTSA